MLRRRPLPLAWTISHVQPIVGRMAVSFVMPSYLDGTSIIEPMASLWTAAKALGLDDFVIVLSDSGSSRTTVDAAQDWATTAGAPLRVDHSDERRSQKAALNAAFTDPVVREADLVVVMVSDVIISPESLAALLGCLLEGNRVVAFGIGPPDRRDLTLGGLAGAWLMDAVVRWAQRLPDEDAPHVCGAFWAVRGQFLKDFRFVENRGSLADDVFLAEYVRSLGMHIGNAWAAEAVGLPRANLRELTQLVARGHVAAPTRRRVDSEKILAATVQAFRDPIGFILYVVYRIAGRIGRRWLVPSNAVGETWDRAAGTLRRK